MAQVNIQPGVSSTIAGQPTAANTQNNMMNSQMSASKKQDKGKTIMSTEVPSLDNKKPEKTEDVKDKEAAPKKKSHWWVWLIIILVLLGAGVAAYFLILKDVFSF